VRIGAGVRYVDAMETLSGLYPELGAMMRRLGSTQVRNSGTIGGNIANGSPIGDMPPALIAAGRDPGAAPWRGAADDAAGGLLHRLRQAGPRPGEFVEAVLVPTA
jgi:xanthine dehydrogenase small subunit